MKRFNSTGSPCVRECKNRKLGCRTDCEVFLAYEEKRLQRAKERDAYCGSTTAGSVKRHRQTAMYAKMKLQGRL